MLMPQDVTPTDWQPNNLAQWKDLLKTGGRDTFGSQLRTPLEPLEAKALHVFGLLAQTFNAAGHLLHFGREILFGDYYLHAFMLACSAIELLSRCNRGDKNLIGKSSEALAKGLTYVGLVRISVGLDGGVYTTDELVALRNLAAHGQGVASINWKTVQVFLHVELLDNFPTKLMQSFDRYYDEVFSSHNPDARKRLAVSGVEPVLYGEESVQVVRSPIRYAIERIYPQGRPSKALKHKCWQVYTG